MIEPSQRRPIRLLELRSAWGAGGGPEKTILLSAVRHDRARVKPIVVYLRAPGDKTFTKGVRARADAVGAKILEVRDRGRLDPCCIAQLRRLARHADVIHAHDYKTDLFGLLLGRGGGHAKLIATAHGWTNESRKVRFYKKVDLACLRFYDKVLAVSEATRDVLLSGGVPERRIEIVRNGIDEQEWRPDNASGDLRAELGIAHDELVIGTVTRLSTEKGIDLLVEIASKVSALRKARHEPPVRFLVAGDGPEREALLESTRWWGLQHLVHFLGHRPDVHRVLNTVDAFMLPSRVENMPNALLEAMALGKPSVAFSVGGIPETMGDAGRLVAPFDLEAFAAELVGLLDSTEQRQALGRAARARIEEKFSFAHRLRRVEEIYEELVGPALERRAPPEGADGRADPELALAPGRAA